jgi:hypothetical protein
MTSRLLVQKIVNLNSLVLRQEGGNSFFIAADNSIIISIKTLSYILQFLVNNSYISPKILEGILEEYNSSREDSVDKLRELGNEKAVK